MNLRFFSAVLTISMALLLMADQLRAGDLALPDATDPVAGMGVNIHFTDARPGELEMISRAGFHWVRMDCVWDATEKVRGVYDFSAYDRLLASLDQFHVRALLILDYANPLYDGGLPTHTDEGRAAFARWAVAAATHFKNRGVLWEIWNEPNGDWFWKPKANPDDYARLAVTVSEAIRQVAPRELVVGPALSGTNLSFVKTIAQAGALKHWSAITIHPFLRGGPEDYGPGYQAIRQLIKEYGAGRDIAVLCGESGYSTAWPGISEKTQALYLARLFLFNVMSGVPVTIWYDWHEDGLDPKEPEHHFGIVRNEYHAGAYNIYEPKPAYEAAATYFQELKGYTFKRQIKMASPADYVFSFGRKAVSPAGPAFSFRPKGGECLVAWTSAPDHHAVSIPSVPGADYQITTFDGKRMGEAKVDGQGRLTLDLDGGPQYLSAAGGF